MYALADKCPKYCDHTYGEVLFVAPIRIWIPRAVWKDKPKLDTSVNVLFTKILGSEAQKRALAFPIFYEFYLDFGSFGVIFMSIFLGFICKKSIGLYNKNSITAIIAYAILCGFWIQYINRSYTAMLCTLFVFLYAPLFIYKKYLK